MNFTREPMILSVITPREGCKLAVRNVGGRHDEYLVDAVEVVSFGNATFFRCLERPKAFLVPVSEYEITEVKETRMVLKTEGEIKKRKGLKRRGILEKEKKETIKPPLKKEKGGDNEDETKKVSSSSSRLLPPPNILIKERLARFKNEEFFEENILPGEVEKEEE